MKGRTLAMACLCGVLLACSSQPTHPSAPSSTVPSAPIEAAPVEAAPGAGVAWLGEAGRMRGFTPDGRELSLAGLPLFNSSNESTGLRSSDGRRLYVVSSGKLTVATAMDGRVGRLIDLPPAFRLAAAPLTAASLSPDGRWLALESDISATDLLLIDLESGVVAASGSLAIDQRGAASPPGGPGLLALPGGRLLMLLPGTTEAVMAAPRNGLLEIQSRVSDHRLSCPSPTLLHALPGSSAAVGYCPMDGRVWWLDLESFRLAGAVQSRIGNPFWGAPLFTPDGRLLYVYDSWDGGVSTVDLVSRKMLGIRATVGRRTALHLPFAEDAYAKGPNFSAALSADGSTLFANGARDSAAGIYALSTRDWSLKAHWFDGKRYNSIWAGGDGRQLYAIREGGALDIIDLRTSSTRTASLGVEADFTVA
jgi:hypothetical protein